MALRVGRQPSEAVDIGKYYSVDTATGNLVESFFEGLHSRPLGWEPARRGKVTIAMIAVPGEPSAFTGGSISWVFESSLRPGSVGSDPTVDNSHARVR